MADKKNWLQFPAYVTGSINQELLLRNEYLAAENHILKSQIKGRLRLSDGERATLAGMAKRLGRKALQEIACIAKNDDQVPGLDKGPLQVQVHIPADLPQPSVATAGVHPRYQAGVAGQMCGRGKPLHP